MAAHRALADLLRHAAGVVPGLNGVVIAHDEAAASHGAALYQRPASGAGNRAALAALAAHWAGAYPEAGPAYCALRCWGILIWQPVYLSVIGVHGSQRVISLARFAQPLADGWTREVRISDHEPAHGDTAQCIELAAREIDACCRQIFDELAGVLRLNLIAARSMQADCVLAALLAIRDTYPDWTDAQVQAFAARWLAALDVEGASGLFAWTRSDGSTALALERKTCCYHYRRRDGEPCSTCPRLAKHERIARLNAACDAARQQTKDDGQDGQDDPRAHRPEPTDERHQQSDLSRTA